MVNRTPLNKTIKAQVIARNGGKFCEKCGRKDGLHFHHIIAVQDGGANDLSNLALLCCGCHKEWHSVEVVSHLSFSDWIQYPPCHELISAMMSVESTGDEVTANEFIKGIFVVANLMKSQRNGE